MTDEELVERLLDWEEYDEGDINDAREAAANRIKELKAELAGGSFYQEKDIDALQDRLAAQAAEIERLNTQCEGLFQAAMNNGQALIIAEDKLAKAMLIIEAYSDDEGYIPKRVVHLWNALHCSNQEGICHCGDIVECCTAALTGDKT